MIEFTRLQLDFYNLSPSVVDVGADDEAFLSSILTVLYADNIARDNFISVSRHGLLWGAACVLTGLKSSALLEAAMRRGRDELVVWDEERR